MNLEFASTFLFVPGNRPDRFSKAAESGADAIIIDLEDAVAPEAREEARTHAERYVADGGRALIRVNGADTTPFEQDLAALQATPPAGLVLPKTESGQVLETIAGRLAGVPLFPIIESAKGLGNMRAIASAPGVCRLMLGIVDLQADLGIAGDLEELDPFRMMLVLESHLAGLASPIDGPCTEFRDADIVAAHAMHVRCRGFGGKLCIHPAQIEPVLRAYLPSGAELTTARRIVEAADEAGGGAFSLDGRMVDHPVILKARTVLARASAAAGNQT